jgi:hypothetical protein
VVENVQGYFERGMVPLMEELKIPERCALWTGQPWQRQIILLELWKMMQIVCLQMYKLEVEFLIRR